MGSGPIDPKELLKGLDSFLTRDGEVKSVDGIAKIFSLMKEARKMVSRCTYLNIILQTRAPEVLVKFIDVGGYKLLNSWLTYSKTTNNIPLLQQILLTLQHLPLTVDHLKQNNTAKLVKQLSKSSEDEGGCQPPACTGLRRAHRSGLPSPLLAVPSFCLFTPPSPSFPFLSLLLLPPLSFLFFLFPFLSPISCLWIKCNLSATVHLLVQAYLSPCFPPR